MVSKKDVSSTNKKKNTVVLCGCGVNVYKAPLKKRVELIEVPNKDKTSKEKQYKKRQCFLVHKNGCTFQKTSCNRYPHLPSCNHCVKNKKSESIDPEPGSISTQTLKNETGLCNYCAGFDENCVYCYNRQCLYIFKRNICGGPQQPEIHQHTLKSMYNIASDTTQCAIVSEDNKRTSLLIEQMKNILIAHKESKHKK